MTLFKKSNSNDLKLTDKQRKEAVSRINRIIGQLNAVKNDLIENHACEESLIQLQASKGAISSLMQKLIDQGILECISDYSPVEINKIIKRVLKQQ